MTDGNRTSPNQRWISFVNASGEVIPPYAILWVKPFLGDFSTLTDADRRTECIEWNAYRPEFPSIQDIWDDPEGVEYPMMFAINSSAEVPIDGTGRMTFATDGPAWLRVSANTYVTGVTTDGSGTSDDILSQLVSQTPVGTPIGGSNNGGFSGQLGSYGFQTVSIVDNTISGLTRVLVMADPGPYEMKLVSPGIYGGPPVKPEDIVAISTTTQGPHPIGACTPASMARPTSLSDALNSVVVPVHFDRQNLLYYCDGFEPEELCSVDSLCQQFPTVFVSPTPTRNIWSTRQNKRLFAIGGNGKAYIEGAKSVGEDGTTVRLLCDLLLDELATIETTGLSQSDSDWVAEINDGDSVTIVWDGCKASIVGLDATCPEPEEEP